MHTTECSCQIHAAVATAAAAAASASDSTTTKTATGRRRQVKRPAAVAAAPAGVRHYRRERTVALIWVLALAGSSPWSLVDAVNPQLNSRHQQQQQASTSNRDNSNNRHQQQKGARPPSDINSSSFFAEIEDLTDSNIRTRFGTLPAEPDDYNQMAAALTSGSPFSHGLDFDRLMDRILQPIEGRSVFSPAQERLVDGFSGHGSTVAADAQNRTTMRFFRNNKTFASIVYMNDNKLHRHQVPSSHHQQQQQQPQHQRKLINCHLVDLEKHSSDVALFESKYEMKTIDIEFKDMMRLIESCTEIARIKRLKPPHLLQQQQLQQQQAAGGGGNANGQVQVQQQTTTDSSSLPSSPSLSPQRTPVLVVGHPQVAPMRLHKRRFVAPQAHGQATPATSGKKSTFTAVMSVAAAAAAKAAAGGQQQPPQQQQQRLVLGEVTPPPAPTTESGRAAGARGGIKEAIQEITSYDSTDLMSIWRGILPGTNWCGMGDRATSYNDLGFEPEIDICCRAHDFCPIRLPAFSSGYGLFNWSFYTRSHCQCDQNFLDCLQRARSPLSAVVMKFYFNIMKTTCLHDNETLSDQQQSSARSNPMQQQQQQSLLRPQQQQQQQHHQPHQQQRHGTVARHSTGAMGPHGSGGGGSQLGAMSQAQYLLLLDQIKASMPIPAMDQSQPLFSNAKHDNRGAAVSAAPTSSSASATTTTSETNFGLDGGNGGSRRKNIYQKH